jgi:DNA polymerase epsilon subunit 1
MKRSSGKTRSSQSAISVYREVVFYLNKTYESIISHVDYVDKVDLELVNHLSGKNQKYVKLSFKNIQDLMSVRAQMLEIV